MTLALAIGSAALALAMVSLNFGRYSVPLTILVILVAMISLGLVVWDRHSRESQRRRYRIVLNALEDTATPHLVTDEAGHVVYANSAARILLEDDRDAGIMPMFSAGNPGSETAQRLADEARLTGLARAEIPRQTPDGPVWMRISASGLEGWPGHVHWQFEDISRERRREAALRDQQERLVGFMDQAPVGFYSVDRNGQFLFANATLAAWLGVSVPDLLDGELHLHDFLLSAPTDGPPYALVPGGAEPLTADVKMRGKQGRMFQASIAQTVVRDADGAVVSTRSLVRDLTPERQIREALRASEARFQRFFEDAPIGIALIDHASCLTEWNRAFETLVAPDIDLLGRPITGLLAERNRETIADQLAAIIDGAELETPVEVRLKGLPTERIGLMFARRLEGGPGEPSGLLLQFIDHTEQRKLEAQFAQSQKMQAVGQLAGGIAHDFNNLLTAMIGFSDLLLMRHKPGDPSFGDIMQIKQNANRAANLVRQLLAFSRQQTLQPRVLNITDALADLSNLLRRLIGENIELRMGHGRDIGQVKVDQGQLEQVIINLAVNARDAMADGGTLTISTDDERLTERLRHGNEEIPPGHYVTIRVADTGTGIPPDIIDRIFDPFFSTKEVGSGTGLGLSTVYGIVRQTGGYVLVDSVPGRGAAFTIYLPRHEVAPEVVQAGAVRDRASRDLTGAGRILLVEDEDPVRVFSARALRNKGYDVIEARSGDEALTHLAADAASIELLITDVVMPRMDGPTLIREIRSQLPDVKVICISGYTEDRFRDRVDGGADVFFLAKPFSLKQLAAAVKDVMQGRAPSRPTHH